MLPKHIDMQLLLSRTLRWGVGVSCVVAFVGGLLYLLHCGNEPFCLADYRQFSYATAADPSYTSLPAILGVYEQTGIKNGTPQNTMKGAAFKTELAEAFPDCRLVVTKETMTVEGMIKIVYDLLKDKLNIVKLTFTSGVNAATEEFPSHTSIERCPLCGIALNEKGVCPKCGWKKA